MHSLRDVPIRQKLARITQLAIAVALGIGTVVLLAVEFQMYRSVMVTEIRSMADVIGTNSRAALAFLDPAAGERTLSALGADPRITAARLYTKEGQLFATYRRTDINPDLIPATAPADGLSLRIRSLTFIHPIRLEGERIGTIYLQFDMAVLYDFLLKHALVVIAVLGCASLAAFALSARLQAIISGPVVHLAQMVKTVTERYDYSVRANKSGEDELGLLTDGFNEMLARIQDRDAALRKAGEELEERVKLRTRELQLEVAERTHAEAALKESEEKYRTLVEVSQDAIFINHNNRIVYVNPATVTLLGAERPEQILNRSPFDIIHPHSHEAVRKRIQRLLEEGTPVPMLEEQYVRLDGTVIDVEVAATPLFYKGEQAIQVVVRDITERRRAEEALRKLSGAVEQAAYSVVITDREGVIEYVNPGFEQLTGYSRDEAIGHTPRLVKSGQHPYEYYEKLWRTLLSGEVFRGVFVNRKKDGTLFFDEEVITPLRDSQGTITHFISVGIDVTERKRAEADLALAHAATTRLYEQTKDDAARWEALFTLSRLLNRSLVLEDVFETFAQAVRSYIAYDRLGVIVAEGGRLSTIYASVPDPSLAASQGKIFPGAEETGIDWVLTHKQPRLLQDLSKEARFRDDLYMAQEGIRATIELPLLVAGDAVGVFFLDSQTPGIYSTRDIERVLPLADQLALAMKHDRLFSSLQHQTDALRLEVQERTRAEAEARRSQAELRALAAHLESVREDERTQVARHIHDELGQLLTGLKIDLSWVTGRLPGDHDALQAKLRSMGTLIDTTIQSVRRISSELRPSLLDDLGLVAAIEWQVKEFQSRTGIGTHLTAEPSQLELDRECSTALFRILQEALTNVARHAQATAVHVTLKADTERITLEVIDNGRGITPQAMADRRALGLLGMRERALLLGGETAITGQPGQGTTVVVVIPLTQPPDGRPAPYA